MTDFHVDVVQIDRIEKHPNADTLSIAYAGDYPVIVKTGSFKPGDLGVYIPVDSVVDINDTRFNFLENGRIKAKKLRGVFSQGLLIQAEPGMYVGDNVAEQLNVTKYLTPEEKRELNVQQAISKSPKLTATCPDYLPRYTDIENLRRHPHVFNDNSYVIVTEKCEGENAGYAYNKLTTWQKFKSWFGFKTPKVVCRSRNQMKYEGKWFELIKKYNLEARFEQLENPEDYSIYGESFGYTSGFDYSTDKSGHFIVFDVYDRVNKRWIDYDEAFAVVDCMGLTMVPILYEGTFNKEKIEKIAEGDTVIGNGRHMMEGVIIRSETEQIGPSSGRKMLKLKSQRYLLRKEQ